MYTRMLEPIQKTVRLGVIVVGCLFFLVLLISIGDVFVILLPGLAVLCLQIFSFRELFLSGKMNFFSWRLLNGIFSAGLFTLTTVLVWTLASAAIINLCYLEGGKSCDYVALGLVLATVWIAISSSIVGLVLCIKWSFKTKAITPISANKKLWFTRVFLVAIFLLGILAAPVLPDYIRFIM